MSSRLFGVLLFPLFGALASCGGGDDQPFQVDDVGQAPFPGASASPGPAPGGGSAPVFLPASNFDGMCVNPRPGTPDVQGTTTDQNNWLRSWTSDTYLWYREVDFPEPSLYTTPVYFDLLKTDAVTASGQAKDRFHFTYDTDEWVALSQGGVSAGYGVTFDIVSPTPPRRIVVVFVEPNSPGSFVVQRGDEIVTVDGINAVTDDTQSGVDTINAGLFPEDVNESHVFIVRSPAGVNRVEVLTSEQVVSNPVPTVSTISTASGTVGYILFNDHIATAEGAFEAAVRQLQLAAVTDLILDMRYNGGGFLDIASEVAYMVANTTLTNGRTFERLTFNDKHPTTDPVTGQAITPTPFHSTSQGFTGAAGRQLPTLNLSRVYIITGPGTCSASESVINSLRGVNVAVYLIGSTTCGKPYGFYPTDNCGTTYFSIQFSGQNATGFGDYTDGFTPQNTTASGGTRVPGCSVADDYTHELGDPAEGRIAEALNFRASNHTACPAATGFTDSRLSKASFQRSDDRSLWVSKSAARTNRILRN